MSDKDLFSRVVSAKELGVIRRAAPFRARATKAECEAVRRALGIERLEALSYEAILTPNDGAEWRLEGRARAKLAQACVLTLEPVAETIDEPFTRLWSAQAVSEFRGAPSSDAFGAEFEDPEFDDPTAEIDLETPEVEPLPEPLDLGMVAIETIGLALDPYPRAPDAAFDGAAAAPPGAEPLTEEAVRPFAGLADLRARMTEQNAEDAGDDAPSARAKRDPSTS